MNKTALLIIDVQTSLIEENPYNKDVLIKNIEKLLKEAHLKNTETIYIRHDSGKNSTLEKDTPIWEIYYEISQKTMRKFLINATIAHLMKLDFIITCRIKGLIISL